MDTNGHISTIVSRSSKLGVSWSFLYCPCSSSCSLYRNPSAAKSERWHQAKACIAGKRFSSQCCTSECKTCATTSGKPNRCAMYWQYECQMLSWSKASVHPQNSPGKSHTENKTVLKSKKCMYDLSFIKQNSADFKGCDYTWGLRPHFHVFQETYVCFV